MIKYEDMCCDCDLPCIGNSCPNKNIPIHYCDECNDETQLYHYNGSELCLSCIEKILEKVN